MTPYQSWKRAVIERPETFKLDRFDWVDTQTGWRMWHANGMVMYCIRSPQSGEIRLPPWDKIRMHSLFKWWASGAVCREKAQ